MTLKGHAPWELSNLPVRKKVRAAEKQRAVEKLRIAEVRAAEKQRAAEKLRIAKVRAAENVRAEEQLRAEEKVKPTTLEQPAAAKL